MKLLHGTRQNGNINPTDIWSIVYFRQKAKNTNGHGSVLDTKKFGSESNLAFSGTHATLGNMFTDENVYVMQINYTYGLYKTILRTEKVDLQANGRANINGDYYMMEGFDQDIGIKKERNLYEWSALPSNVKLTPNAVRAGLSYRRDLGNKKAILLTTNYTGTQVGGMYNVTTSYQMGKHQVFINYQDKAKGINKNIQSNLLPNVSQRISAGYGAKDINIFGAKADIGANITYLPKNKDFFVGGKIKFNINAKKKKRTPSGF